MIQQTVVRVMIAFVIAGVLFLTATVKGENKTAMRRIPIRQMAHYDKSGNLEFFPAIVGGTPAIAGEFPSHVSIQTRSAKHICGGTLIDFDYVLTAAHCVSNDLGEITKATELQVMTDDLTITKVGASAQRQIRNVYHVFIHPEYNTYTAHNDIAVLKVAQFSDSKTLSVASLASESPQEGALCMLAGWGAKKESSPRPNPQLFKAEMTVTNTHQCNVTYSGDLSGGMFCAKGKGQDACRGDSGGALLCSNEVSGIVSFGNGCDQPEYPGVYTDVSMYEEFIDECFRTIVEVDKNEKAQETQPSDKSDPG